MTKSYMKIKPIKQDLDAESMTHAYITDGTTFTQFLIQREKRKMNSLV